MDAIVDMVQWTLAVLFINPKPHMNTPEKHLEELPSLSYVKALAKTDVDFQRKFLTTLKEKYAVDSLAYLYHIEVNEPRAASEIVNRLKYAFSFLSMKEAFEFAERHQEKLWMGNTGLNTQFQKIMVTVRKFLDKN